MEIVTKGELKAFNEAVARNEVDENTSMLTWLKNYRQSKPVEAKPRAKRTRGGK